MKHRVRSDLPDAGVVEMQLAAYHDLVRKYHRTLDLVSDAALDRFEALIEQARAYAQSIDRVGRAGRVLDVGSGVGLPGIVVAVALPHRHVLLVERRRRRATFLRIVVAHLGLENARVSEADVREVHLGADSGGVQDDGSIAHSRAGAGAGVHMRKVDPEPSPAPPPAGRTDGFAVVTAQAVAALVDIYCLTRHLHATDITLVARKGPSWQAEVEAMEARIGAEAAVRGETPLPDSGTLVAIDVPGGLPCPPSG